MKSSHLLFLSLALLACDVAEAQVTSVSPAPDGQTVVVEGVDDAWDPAAEKKKKVCKRSTETGSIMPKVTCRSKGEWDLLTERSKADIEKLKAERVAREHTRLIRENGS